MMAQKPGTRPHRWSRRSRLIIAVVLLLGVQQAAGQSADVIIDSQTWTPTYTWDLRLDAAAPASIPVGGDATITYTATPSSTLTSASVVFSARVSCTPPDNATVTGAVLLFNGIESSSASQGQQQSGQTNIPFPNQQTSIDTTATTQLSVVGRCQFSGTPAQLDSSPKFVPFTVTGTPSATLTASTDLPQWSQYNKPPRLVTAPSVGVSSGRPSGTSVSSNQLVSWTVQLDDVYVCLTGAQAVTTATLASTGSAASAPVTKTNVVTLNTANNCQVDSPTLGTPTGDGRVVNTYRWTITKTVSSTAVSIARGSEVSLDYRLEVTKTPSSYTAALTTFTVPVTNPASGLSTSLDRCDVVFAGNVVATKTGQTIAAGAGATVQFTNIALTSSSGSSTSSAAATGTSSPTTADITTRCYFDGSSTPVEAVLTINLNADTTSSSGATAKIVDTFTYPTWSNLLSNLLPAPVPTITGSNPNGQTVSDTTSFSYTLKLSSVVICLQGQTITNTATVTPVTTGTATSTGTSQASTSTTLTVTDCNACPTINANNLQTTTTIQNTWAHTMAPVSSSGATVPWGEGATLRMRSTLTKQVTSFNSFLTAELAIANPTAGPIIINSITLQCQSTGTINLPCGSLSTTSNNLGQLNSYSGSSALLIPGGQTTTCQFTNQPLAGSVNTNFQQPCTINIVTASGTTCNSPQFTLDLLNPLFKNDINNCVDYSVTCGSVTGSQFYRPSVSGGVTNSRVCGDAGNSQLPTNVEFDVSVNGGFQGDGTLPGSCGQPATVTCTGSGIGVTTVGTGGGSQQITPQTATLTFSPVACPVPPPSTAPSSPTATPPTNNNGGNNNNGGPNFSATRNPVVTVDVQETIIKGSFAWQAAITAAPPALDLAAGDTKETQYTVQLTRVPASNSQPPSYLLRGVVTVANPAENDGPQQITKVTTVVGTTQQPLASCTNGGVQVTLPFSLAAGATLSCPFFFNYDPSAPLSNTLFGRASIMTPSGETTPTSSDARADFSFAGATSNKQDARGVCANVWMRFNTDYLALTRTLGEAPPFLADQAQQVCDNTAFTFGVALSPSANAPCGPTQVLSTVLVNYIRDQAEEVTATNNLPVTITGGCNTAAEAVLPAGAANMPGATPAPTEQLALEIQGISSKDVQSVVWGLQMVPDQPEVAISPTGADVKYNISWTRTTDTVTEVTGSLVVTNTGSLPALLEGVTVELVAQLRRGKTTVAQANALCPFPDSTAPAEVSASNVLPVAATVTCTFTLRAKSVIGASLVATVSLADTGDTASSPTYAISQFREASAASGCAVLLSGLAASNLQAGGRLTADPEGVIGPEVCEPGSKQVTFKMPVPSDTALCGDYQVTALASLVPSTDTTRTPLFATATAKVRLLSGCVIQVNEVSLSVSRVRGVKTRLMNWTISRTMLPELPGNSALQVPTTENVTDVFKRSLVPGQFLQLSGSVLARTTGDDATPLQQTQILAMVLCLTGAQCSVAVQAPKAACNITGKSGPCPFRFDKVPAAGILLLPVLDAPVPGVSAAFFSPNAAARRQVLGKCAKLTVEPPAVTPADQGVIVTVTSIANPPPADAVCSTSWVTTRQFVFETIEGCSPNTRYEVASEARAQPTDAAADAAVVELKFDAKCNGPSP